MTEQSKPLVLKAALVLSSIGSSILVLAYFGAAIFFDQTVEQIQSITNIRSTVGTSPLYFSILGGFYLISLLGVILMMREKKSGFWFYVLAQLPILAFPIFWLGENSFSTSNTIFTLIFSLIYLSFYKQFK